MDQEILRNTLGRIMLVIFLCLLIFGSFIFFNKKWTEIRDVRRQADAQSIIKALDIYEIYFNKYPATGDNDGDGWDNSNDVQEQNFLQPLVEIGLLPDLVFDPKNDTIYYYRYQHFPAGTYGCQKAFAVFQINAFENQNQDHGQGQCPQMNFVSLSPDGFTWMGVEN